MQEDEDGKEKKKRDGKRQNTAMISKEKKIKRRQTQMLKGTGMAETAKHHITTDAMVVGICSHRRTRNSSSELGRENQINKDHKDMSEHVVINSPSHHMNGF